MTHGKRREFAIGLLLSIVTLGIYPAFWHYMAFKELYEQEGRDDFPIALYVCSFLPVVSLVTMPMFMAKNLELLNDMRTRRQLAPIFGIGGFLAWYILGSFIVVGPIVAYYKLQQGLNDIWDAQGAARAPASALPAA